MNILVNLAGLSRHLHLPLPWLRAEANAGRIPCLKVGRKRLFNVEAVEDALAERAAHGAGKACSPDGKEVMTS